MIEESLVYICADAAGKEHIGCGVTIEGGLIATCRHVWRDVGLTPHVHFPRSNSAEALQPLTLADDCQDEGAPPDCVLLRPFLMPNGIPQLHLALKDSLETGEAQCRAHLLRGNKRQEVSISGKIDEAKDPDGRRQFTGQMMAGYWFDRGSSGSPVFKKGGQQLAAILSLSELGANNGPGLYEAFVVPASVMRKYVLRVQAEAIAQPLHLSRAKLDDVLREIGAADVPSDEALARLKSFIQEAKAQAAEPLPIVTEGGDVPAVIAAAREKVGTLDIAGAVQILEDRLAQESKVHETRMVALLREKAAMERLSFRREEAIATMLRLLALAPAAPWDWITLGDLQRAQGGSTETRKAYERALTAAIQHDPAGREVAAAYSRIGYVVQAQGDLAGALAAYQRGLCIAEGLATKDPSNAERQRDLSVSQNNIGNVLQAQGDLAGALVAYQRSMTIAEALATCDPSNAEWQRDLSVCHNKIGDVLRAQGDLAGALAAHQRSMLIAEQLAASDPSNSERQRDLSVCQNRIGDMLRAQGDLAGTLAAYQRSMAIAGRIATSDPTNKEWQSDLSISLTNIGDVLQAQGDLAGALAAHESSMNIAEQLATVDPSNAAWQRDLSISHDRIGEVRRAQGDLAGALAAYQRGMDIAEALAASDPSNTQWQRDLSVSQDRIGELGWEQGDLAAALTAFQRSMAIAEALVACNPGNAEWQRDLSVCHN
ncbi:MAG: tetratricopeptide repeat protein, partial [Roseomonas sp.]|nr:tetratricopeptide repeat protein [Roseomonas sp.]